MWENSKDNYTNDCRYKERDYASEYSEGWNTGYTSQHIASHTHWGGNQSYIDNQHHYHPKPYQVKAHSQKCRQKNRDSEDNGRENLQEHTNDNVKYHYSSENCHWRPG